MHPVENTLTDKLLFLKGGGEMGEIIRSFNWAGTPIGPPGQWPQSLGTTLGIVLHSAFPMFLFWGEDLICFYNDAFRPSLGIDGKHPAIGKKGKEVWAEIWELVGPMIMGVMATGEPVYFEDQLIPFYRNGRMEEIYWTFSYSPAYGDNGKINGVFVTCTETTGKVILLNRLKASEENFRNMVRQAPVGMCIANGPELLVVEINDLFLQIVGKPREAFNNAFYWDVNAEVREYYEPITTRVLQTGQTYQAREHEVVLIRNGQPETVFIDFVYEPIKDEHGKATAIMIVAIDVTDKVIARRAQQRINEELAAANDNVRNIITQSPVAMGLFMGLDMKIEVINDKFLELWEKDNSVIGQPVEDALPELRDQPYPEIMRRVFNTGETYYGYEAKVVLNRHNKPEEGFYNFVNAPFRNSTGNTVGIVVVATEVTEHVRSRREAERVAAELEVSETRLRSVIGSAPFPIAVYVGREMRIAFANQAIMDVWGKGNDVVGKTYHSILPELANQQIYPLLDAVFTTGVPFNARNQRVDLVVNNILQTFYFNYSFTPLYDAAGKVYGVMNTAAEVTDLNIAKQKLEQSERNLRNMILQSPVAMCILLGPEYVIEVANEPMIELWGKLQEDIMYKPVFEALPDAREQGLEQLMDDVYNTGITFTANERPVVLLRKGNFETVYQNFVYEPYRDGDGKIIGVLVVSIDVTEQVFARQKIEEVVAERTKALAEANSSLQRSNAELAQFAYIASHDLQEPVRKVSMYAQMLAGNFEPADDRAKGYLAKIQNSSSRMLLLIKDILAYSELSKTNQDFVEVNLQNVVDEIKTDFELLIEQKQATITARNLPVIEAIPLHLSQLFSNLVSNALKYSNTATRPAITITAHALSEEETARHHLRPHKKYYAIEVKDNGIGFSPEHAGQIFNIFQRLHGKKEYEGTGIGLAICQKIVQNHQGKIYAASQLSEGSTFTVILPELQENII